MAKYRIVKHNDLYVIHIKKSLFSKWEVKYSYSTLEETLNRYYLLCSDIDDGEIIKESK